MALHKENYGLIYNDDGSLCVTLRKDDVPFEGVTSFAVEEGTTNLVTDPYLQTGNPNSSGVVSYRSLEIFDVNGWTMPGVRLYQGSDIGDYEVINFSLPTDIATQIAGKQVTLSVYAKSSKTGQVLKGIIYCTVNGTQYFLQADNTWGTDIGEYRNWFAFNNANVWERKVLTLPPFPAGTLENFTITHHHRATTSFTLDVTGFQIETKPFATSFVDGMRADGQLRIENVLRNRDSWVVSFWYKHPGDFSDARMLFGSSESDIADPNEFSVFVTSTGTIKILNRVNNTTIFSIESSASIPANEWIFLTFIYTGSEIRAYMNRNQILSGTATINWNFTAGDPSKLWIGSVRTGNLSRTGGLFANLLIARYQPAVWTAEYIQELYNMRRPFSVPPKMPII